MAFPDGFIDEVRRTADIVRLVSDHVGLKKMGQSWKGLCPFHDEKTPSFNVRQEPPLFHCFGCGEGGDVFKFVMLRERASFPEAVETVARRFGIPVPENRYEPGPDRKERDELFAVMEAAAEHFTKVLWTSPGTKAREYLLGRGFKKETLERIRAGAAPDSWSDLLDGLRRRFPVAAILKAGLVLEKQAGGGHYDRFRNRAVFPIANESGKVVAFGARSLDGSEPKYLNSPETPIYQKSRTLYGLSWAKEASRKESRLVLMEGYLDVARALEGGTPEAIATCGTALTPAHARLIRRFAERVVVNFDQDEAGQKAAQKSLDLLASEGLTVSVVTLPGGHDPDSFVKAEGGRAYRERLDAALPWIEWLIRKAAAEHDTKTPLGKAGYFQAVLPSLARLESAVERSAWLQVVVEKGRLDGSAALGELKRALATGTAPVALAAPAAPALRRPPTLQPAEKWLISLLLQEASGVDEALGELSEAQIEGLASAEVLKAAKALYRRGLKVTAAGLAAEVQDETARRLVTEMAVSPGPTGNATALDCAREIQCWPLEARLEDIQQALRSATGDELALRQEQVQLRRRINELCRPAAPVAGASPEKETPSDDRIAQA
jgi:DNA primase